MSTIDIKTQHISDIINEANSLKERLQIQDTNTILFILNLADSRIRNDNLEAIIDYLDSIDRKLDKITEDVESIDRKLDDINRQEY